MSTENSSPRLRGKGHKIPIRKPNVLSQKGSESTGLAMLENGIRVINSNGQNVAANEKCKKAGLLVDHAGKIEISEDQPIVIVEKNLCLKLSAAARKVVDLIMDELRINNMMWYNDDASLVNAGTIAELKKHNIITPVEATGYYFVNPTKIRRGRTSSIFIATHRYLKEHGKYNSTVDLKPGSKTSLYIKSFE